MYLLHVVHRGLININKLFKTIVNKYHLQYLMQSNKYQKQPEALSIYTKQNKDFDKFNTSLSKLLNKKHNISINNKNFMFYF